MVFVGSLSLEGLAKKGVEQSVSFGGGENAKFHLVHGIGKAEPGERICEANGASCSRMPEGFCMGAEELPKLLSFGVERIFHKTATEGGFGLEQLVHAVGLRIYHPGAYERGNGVR